MARHLFKFHCPCCDKLIELDTRSGKARAMEPEQSKAARDMEQLLKQQKDESQRLTDVFSEAAADQERQRQKLDDAFGKAFEDAKKDKEKPRNPFDLE